MKAEIHPEYKEINVICACGNNFVTRSTYRGENLRLDVCNECHPFNTGKQKLMDTAGRVDQYWKRYGGKKAE
ncbi:MAG: 50S ribosomal protein L31 [Candidatus Berkiellales bacterium]